jgi:hypothetical protein
VESLNSMALMSKILNQPGITTKLQSFSKSLSFFQEQLEKIFCMELI